MTDAPAEPLDLSGPIRLAILANSAITDLLNVYKGEPAVFTRRPIPADAPYPCIVVPPIASLGDRDAIKMKRPLQRRDIIAYGEQPDQYRDVEAIGYLLRQQFHRNKFAFEPDPAYTVMQIIALGPMVAPVDDDRLLGRAVPLEILMKELAT